MEKHKFRKSRLCAATALCVLTFAVPLYAQSVSGGAVDAGHGSESNGGIEEILVTAQRRTENVQDVPIAISAFSSGQLERIGATNTLDIGNFVPNLLSFNNTGLASANAYFLRGLGSTDSMATADPAVGTYIDDIYLSRQSANNLSFFDVERIEVLRGPQGTLFGRNTTGGAINVILKDPGKKFGGAAEVGYGSYHKVFARASVDIPLAETLQIKLSGYYQDDRGYAKNTTTKQWTNDDDGWGVRLGIKGELASWARWKASYIHVVADGENLPNFECDPANPGDCKGRYVTTGMRVGRMADVSPYPLAISGEKARYLLGNHTSSNIVTSNLEFDVTDNARLNLITGYIWQVQKYAIDFYDGRAGPSLANPVPAVQGYPYGSYAVLNDGKTDQISQEIKINGQLFDNSINYVVGAFYLKEQGTTDFADLFAIFSQPTVSGSSFTPLLLADRTLKNSTRTFAGYAQVDFNLIDRITLTAGIRYTDDTKKISIRDNRALCNSGGSLPASCLDNANLISANGVRFPLKQSVGVWTPRFAINYRPADDILLFASATRGFKSGGWSARSSSPTGFYNFGPEKVWSYETGFKSEFFDRHARFNLTAYYMKVDGIQAPTALVASNGAISFVTRNSIDYINKGIEAELTVVPTTGLNLYANLGYMDDKFKLPSNPQADPYGTQSIAAQITACLAQIAAGVIPTGSGSCASGLVGADGGLAEPTRTPDFTLSIGGSYEIPLGDSGWKLIPAVNAYYRSKQETAGANLTFYTGSITGSNGTFPSNPYGGDFITGSFSPSVWLFTSSLALIGSNGWQLSLQCNNCTNKTRVTSSLANVSYLNIPRTWMMKAQYKF
ncbi:MAG: TonB-dependent receptor [Sphingobium sp.]